MLKFSSLPGLSNNWDLEMDFVFGVELVDNADNFNPKSGTGHLVLKSGELPLASNKLWLRQFCSNLKNAPFYVPSRDSCYVIELFLQK